VSPSDLSVALSAALAAHPDGTLCVALSGGPDSTALLHALAQLPQARARGLRALHVDHGLHNQSAQWALQCEAICNAWQIELRVLKVQVERASGDGIEAAARKARYAVLADALREGERLVLGHHRDDQIETVLLKLLRGAGPEGLGGMRAQRELGRGLLWRPLLDLPRKRLCEYIDAHGLGFVTDPSNRDRRYSRNRLRHDVLPVLDAHWPHAGDAILHSARLSRAAADALATQWQAALNALLDPLTQSLDASGWHRLAPALREPLLDHWLHERGCTAPTTAQRTQIEKQIHAREGRMPCVRWAGTELHIWKGRLWARQPLPAFDPQWESSWRGEPLALPDGGLLTLSSPVALSRPLTVRLRRGGERIRPAGDAHTRELRDLFQQAGLPPWQRTACPLIYDGETLIAVADRWLGASGKALFDALGSKPCWQAG
jgi:tRNA(Ile)-lysidine synthase